MKGYRWRVLRMFAASYGAVRTSVQASVLLKQTLKTSRALKLLQGISVHVRG